MAGPSLLDVALRWRDMDAYGHVNNGAFFTFLEQARVEGLPLQRTRGTMGLVVARQEIEYLRPLSYRPDGVRVRMWCTRIGGAGFDLGYEVVTSEADDPRVETVHARAETTMVSFDFVTETPRRLQPDDIEALRLISGPAVSFRRRAATP